MKSKNTRKFNIDDVRSSYIGKEGRIEWVPCIKTVNDPELSVEKKVDILIEEVKISMKRIAGSFETLNECLNKDLNEIWEKIHALDKEISSGFGFYGGRPR